MADYNERKAIIEKIEKARGSFLVTYVLPDRGNITPVFVGDDALRPIHTLLAKAGKKETIDLFIYTRGGSMMSAPTIVRLFREYAKRLRILVPFKCHSAGTLIALGADEVVMSKIGQLSPVDPTTANAFNPILNPQLNPADIRNRKAISVEDVQSYLTLAKERVGLVSESDRLEVFKELTKVIEPLALGNVNRIYSATRMIAKQMLSEHMDPHSDDERIDALVKALTETYPHDFIITRDLASKIGLKVTDPSLLEENLMMELLDSYSEDFNLNTPFDPEDILNKKSSQTVPTQQVIQPMIQVPQAPTQPNQPSRQEQVPQIPAQPPSSSQASSQMPIQLQQFLGAAQPPVKPVNLSLKLGAIESRDDAFVHVAEASIYPPQQLPGQLNPVPSVSFKVGTWRNINELGGVMFE